MPPRTRARADRDTTAAPQSDAYTGLLFISLMAMIGGIVLLWMDYSQYPSSNPPKVPERQAATTPPPQPGGGGGGGGGGAPPPPGPGGVGAGGAGGAPPMPMPPNMP